MLYISNHCSPLGVMASVNCEGAIAKIVTVNLLLYCIFIVDTVLPCTLIMTTIIQFDTDNNQPCTLSMIAKIHACISQSKLC